MFVLDFDTEMKQEYIKFIFLKAFTATTKKSHADLFRQSSCTKGKIIEKSYVL